MARILITGGRAPVSLDLARYLDRRGHEVFVAESQNAQLSRGSRAVKRAFHLPSPRFQTAAFEDALLKIVREEKIDLLIPTCEEVFYVARMKERLQAFTRVLVDDFDKLDRLHDKWRFVQWAEASGFPVPASHRLADPRDWEALTSDGNLKDEWVLKPAYSRFGARVFMGPVKELRAAPIEPSPREPWLVQRKIEGREFCAYAIADKGRVTAISIYSHDFVAGRAGICFEEIDHPGIERAITDFVRAIDYHGQIAFDFIEQTDGAIFALECNPRATSGLHMLLRLEGLDRLLLGQEGARLKAPHGRRAMLLLAMLLFGIGQITSPRRCWLWWKTVLTAREIVFSWRDPWPFFDQLLCFADLARQSRRHKVSVLDMSTLDIEWNGAAG